MAEKKGGYVTVDEGRVFKLRAGRSLYALRVSEAGTLDHLYWGPALPHDADLRYIIRSNVAQPFDPTVDAKASIEPESAPGESNAALAEVANAQKTLLELWREHRGAQDGEKSSDAVEGEKSSTFQRRLENLTWRLLAMNKLSDKQMSSRAASLLRERAFGMRPEAPSGMPRIESSSSVASEASEPTPPSLEHFVAQEPTQRPLRRTVASVPCNLQTVGSTVNAEASRRATVGSTSVELTPMDLLALDLSTRDSELAAAIDARERDRRVSGEHPRRVSGEHSGVGSGERTAFGSDELAPPGVSAPSVWEGIQQPQMRDQERVGKNTACMEFSDHGTGDYRSPSFMLRYSSDGSTLSPMVYESHRIVPGKPPVPEPLPHVRECATPATASGSASDEPAATTLVITMVDKHTGMRVDLHFTAMHHLEVVVRRAVVRNPAGSGQRVELLRLMSATVDFDVPLHSYWLTQLNGSWARERSVCHTQLHQGKHGFGSLRGTSSHQHSPFVAISEGLSAPSEEHGDVYGFTLVYSGSFEAEAEVVDVGRLRVNMGLQSLGFCWTLEPGAEFSSPECVCVFSSAGLGRMSRQLHALVREHVIPPAWRHVPMPVLVNTWEAEYFAVTHDSVVAMARAAKQLDVEMIVLDDGWFGERHDATSSLGDWFPNSQKFPFGIRGLARDVVAEGMLLGLWIEPEMVSTNSTLFAQHPDWCLHVPGRLKHEGRNQLVLDLTRPEVRGHIFEQIAAILRTADIAYVKWDMNRHLTEAFSVVVPSHRQGEVMHRYTLGVFELHRMFTTAFPHIRFEGCSGGGGRFDLGMLYYCPQIWCSDNTDALMRMKIQHGSSFVFPALTIGAHYSIVPNHITQGVTRKRTRALVAMCGTFGYELDLRKVPPLERQVYRRQVAAHKLVSPIVRDGDLYRLWDPFAVPYCAWMYVKHAAPARSRSAAGGPSAVEGYAVEAAVFAFNMESTFWSTLTPRLVLRGLATDALYDVSEPLPNNRMQKTGTLEVVRTPTDVYQLGAACVRMHGATLMSVGIPVRFLTQDDSLLFLLQKVKQ